MLAEAESDRLIGLVVGGAYQLVGRIGEGGMGAVYEAHHLRLQKRVAVKLMNRAMVRNPDALARFHREARVASRLGHPNLVNVLDFGSLEEGQPYLVMEHLEGEDLDRRIHRAGSVPLANAIQIARQVASALAVVHAKGIVHRDLKPANIFLVQVPGEPDFVKVLDFGVSKIKAARTKLTDASTLVGTPEYMSPEQASGLSDDIDHRADQWALACIVWEMLSGRTPFAADNTDAVFYQLANLAPSPLAKRAPDLPSAVESVLLRALSKRAQERYGSMREFARALELAALGSCSDFTPMPLEQSKPVASCEAIASSGAALDVSLDGHAGRRRGPRLRAALVGVAITVVVTAGGVLFAGARGGGATAGPTQRATGANAPVVRARPAVSLMEPKKAELDGALVLRNAAVREKVNSSASSSASHARRSKSRGKRAGRHSMAKPVGTRLMFEEL
jgi:serine/threonine protein kinase